MALNVKPNPGHHALAALAKHRPDFLCLTQNVDGLSPRAGHPLEQLRLLHGSLFDIKCFNKSCDYIEHENYADPFFPAISAASQDVEPGKTLPLLDPFNEEVAKVPESEIPKCPKCKTGLLRPGVLWFNEMLDFNMLNEVDDWIQSGKVDLMLVVGTSAVVRPASGYIRKAQYAGAKIATINIDAEDNPKKIRKGDFAFGGDAAELLPKLLEPVIGKIRRDGTFGEPTKPEEDE
ncbi:putative nad-dependent deacetylase sirtuin-5 protein [Phaeoacremonium minimum UCRPA7]|uniref:Putative nad-dependent deacetylase sirtuin-5 protein n=1 Tax=Phaeoacremonium minimum (strain UCR-PA7) TaxID=1286976 RepID=R8BR48_PHAM7|nr:putative nad-dependent deacetylase sirtuin-5 protein [Phaeoacremonium minimum UCRPA7]EOO01775.1 putative nad-dependent deacetylase sirtuin-5 protein [Phaeoacremonium minimum UCRPA7]